MIEYLHVSSASYVASTSARIPGPIRRLDPSRRCRHEVALQGVRAPFPEAQQKKECPECARKDEKLKSYFTKLNFIAPSCAKLVPVN